MSNRKQFQAILGSDGLIIVLVILFIATSWSWFFLSKVAQLADSLLVGYLMALFGFSVIVGLSSFIFIKTILKIKHNVNQRHTISFWIVPLMFFIWAGTGYLVSWLIAVIWIGKGGSWDTVLPFSSLTPLLAHTPLRYLGRFVGFYGVTAAAMTMLFVFCMKKLRRFAVPTIAFILLATLLAWRLYSRPNGQNFRAVIVSEGLYDKAGKVQGTYDLAVFPEYGLVNYTSYTERLHTDSKKEAYYIGSKKEGKIGDHENALVFGTDQRGVLEERHKSRLIPAGEYVPYFIEVILRMANANHTLSFFNSLLTLQKGAANFNPLYINNNIALGSGICSSIIATEDYRHFTAHGATVLTNSASLSHIDSKLYTFLHEGQAMFMASANARPFLQSSNAAPAFALDNNGAIVARISPIQSKIATIKTNKRRTPYTILGEWPVYVGLAILAVMGAEKIKVITKARSKKTQKKK